MTNTPVLYWIRDDLRVSDNPALTAACRSGQAVIAIYILGTAKGERPIGAASAWWLHHALADMKASLEALGIPLVLKCAEPKSTLLNVVKNVNAQRVFWNRRYDPSQIKLDKELKATLTDKGVEVTSCKANLLFEPWEVAKKGDDDHYKVFSPFWRAAMKDTNIEAPLATPDHIDQTWQEDLNSDTLEDWELVPTQPNWATEFANQGEPTEVGAKEVLADFIDEKLKDYASQRDKPGRDVCSQLSPYLRFGQISPRQVNSALQAAFEGHLHKQAYKFLSEIGWREFAHTTLFYSEDLKCINLRSDFDAFPWRDDEKAFMAWCQGQTGYPMVDAGMRELWSTGRMHNRVRMVTASFLVKHLMIDWRKGEEWFWDTLVDACPANNPFSWQWVAGCGADAAPYFRIFNPILQVEKFDPKGVYIRKWVPELAALPDKCLAEPAKASELVLKEAGIKMGEDYPLPIVDHSAARERALAAYKGLSDEA